MGMCGSKKDILFVGVEALHETCRRPVDLKVEAASARLSPAEQVVAQNFKDVQACIEAGDVKGLLHLLDSQLARHRGPDGGTALHVAARGQSQCIALILAAGAPVDARNKAGVTPLMCAAESGAAGAVRSLLGAHAVPTLEDSQGHTALWHAKEGKHDDVISALGGSKTLKVGDAAVELSAPPDQKMKQSPVGRRLIGASKDPEAVFRIRACVSKSMIFGGLDGETLDTVIARMAELRVRKGDTVIRQGDVGEDYYVVESGRCDCHVQQEHALIGTELGPKVFACAPTETRPTYASPRGLLLLLLGVLTSRVCSAQTPRAWASASWR